MSAEEEIRQGAETWRRLGRGAHLDEWLAIGKGLMHGRAAAMQAARTNAPRGSTYKYEFSLWIRANGYGGIDRVVISNLLWLFDEEDGDHRLDILESIRQDMTPGQRSRLNSPTAAKQRVRNVLAARGEGKIGTPYLLSKRFHRDISFVVTANPEYQEGRLKTVGNMSMEEIEQLAIDAGEAVSAVSSLLAKIDPETGEEKETEEKLAERICDLEAQKENLYDALDRCEAENVALRRGRPNQECKIKRAIVKLKRQMRFEAHWKAKRTALLRSRLHS